VRHAIATLCALVASLASRAGYATPSARLVYSRAHGAESCPDERALRAAVAVRVGYDPFFPWAKQIIVASMAPAPSHGFVASVSLVDEQGVDHGKRSLRTDGECQELVDAAALAIAIAIDPQSLVPRPAPPSEAPASPQSTAHVDAPAIAPSSHDVGPAPSPVPAAPWTVEASAGAVASGGSAPSPVFGGAVGVAIRWARVSLGLEGRLDAPATAQGRGGGSVSAELGVATLLPCVHFGRVFACAAGQIGAQRESSEGVLDSQRKWWPWLAAGGRLGVEVPLQNTLGLRVRSDIVYNVNRPALFLHDMSAWTAPAVSTSLGADAVVHFE
jgi:hypothetical protein